MCQIKAHVMREAIEVRLACKVPLKKIAEEFGVSEFAACRHRKYLKTKEREYWFGLRRIVRASGITKKDF